MEVINVTTNAERFDELVHKGPPEHGDLRFAYKAGVMETGGRPGLAFRYPHIKKVYSEFLEGCDQWIIN